MALSTALAKALFDNAAESPEELAFRKGDILMVLDQEGGGPGWWLCSLHGRQGIAPANRLRLLNTTQPSPAMTADSAATQPRTEDSVYLSPAPHPRPAQAKAARGPGGGDESVYLSPSPRGATVVTALCRGDGRPRSRSSSGSRPRPDWDACTTGRARSPSLRGRGSESGSAKHQTLYQTPTAHRLQGGSAPEAVYLSPCGVPRVAADSLGPPESGGAEAAYLVPREAAVAVGNSEGCYLLPRAGAQPSEEVYQTPTGGTAADPVQGGLARGDSGQLPFSNGTNLNSQTKVPQEIAALYQTPTVSGMLPVAPQSGLKLPGENMVPVSCSASHKHISCPTEGSPRVLAKIAGSQGIPSTPPSARGRLPQGHPRNSPILGRAGSARVQGSPSFARKPPPPAPPVRGVTKKEKPAAQQGSQVDGQQGSSPNKAEGPKDGTAKDEENVKKRDVKIKRDQEEGEYEEPDDENLRNQVYDTPPTNRWQHTVQPLFRDNDDSIYNTPRTHPPHNDQGSEVYDVPTLTLTSVAQQQTYNVPAGIARTAEAEDDVYSVPTLPGLSAVPDDVPDGAGFEANQREVYRVPATGKRGPADQTDGALRPEDGGEGSDRECGIYDMPALSVDASLSSTRRSSVSSTGSGDLHWKTSLSNLIQATLNSASASASSSPRDLAASLTEILSVWKGYQATEAPPPILQAWSRMSDLLPALSACGSAPPSESLLSLVQRVLEDAASLLQSHGLPPSGRPRLLSQESLSRRPLPALPVAEVKPLNVGMGSRKGSWIQERPLPPPPPPSFPLPPVPPPQPNNDGQDEGEELGNEYAGIGLPVAPPTIPMGDSGGYVKLQGKPDPPAFIQTENSHATPDPPVAEQRSSPSPPLPVSLSLEDSELLSFYSSQSLSHLSCLADSIDALFTSVQGNQPPRIFVSRGKSLIVTAHKLVFIGDTLSRLLTSPDLRAKVTTSGGRLCQALKAVVVATKGAAQNYPSVSATQEMVDRVAELSQHAAGFSGLLQRLAEIS
ncbi:embryonal Fyn-associated substrate-like [Scleropages formosus]|uniref:Embryonal Fyn-associated substrate n=1 Tax=Scleropages formosus TaxID=113540 RepID=A0A8C9RD43_SCLFO|nr:embryonal Fyn-associated substrate-like [Scleropages formosus]XP_018601949.1 embryonal Fyn-associated substrate-like [Scleropages formosus]